jgi:hypothetical protein
MPTGQDFDLGLPPPQQESSAKPSNDIDPGLPPSPHRWPADPLAQFPDAPKDNPPASGGAWPNHPIAGRHGADPWAEFPDADTSTPSYDVPKSFGSGLIGGTEGLIGLRGDIRHAADYGMLWAEAHTAEKLGQLPKGQTAADVINKYRGSAGRAFLSQVGVPDSAIDWIGGGAPTTADVRGVAQAAGVPDYKPQTTAGQYAYTVGSFVPGALAAPAEGPAGVAANVARYAIAPGVASETAGQLTQGSAVEPYARTVAGVLGGSAAALGESAARSGIQGAKDFVEPMTTAGQTSIAARKLQSSFTDPQQASRELAAASALQVPGGALGEIVPGSKPTTGQLTGDLGALSLEREFATRQPDLYRENEFGTGAQQQNAARTAALQNIQPGGSPTDIGQFVRQHMAEIDAQHSDTVQRLLADAQGQAANIGAGTPPEALGANLRAGLQNARDAAKANERGLWNAVDPDGTLSLPSAPVVSGANQIARAIPPTAKPMAGEEAAIFQTAAALPQVAPFSDITALRSRISAALRQEVQTAGQTPTYARLSQLRGNVENAIQSAAQNKAAQEAQAVAQGALPPEATWEARTNEWLRNFYASKNAARASGVGDGVSSSFGHPSDIGAPGAAGQGGSGPGRNAGSSGIPGEALPNWDADAAARLKAASGATQARAQTFDQGPVGDVLRRGQTASDYRLPDSAVPGRMFVPGPRGAQTAQAYQAAAGTGGMDPLLDTAAESLRREAMTPDGVIDPGKFANWQNKHQDALRALPAPLRARFSNAASATQAYQDAAAARKAALDTFQKTTAGKFVGLSNPQDITKTVGGLFGPKDGVRQMQSLAQAVSSNPAAQEGLRKAVTDHILSIGTGATESGASGVNNLNPAKLSTFLTRNAATIKAAGFSDPEIQNMSAVATDLQRSQRTLQATRLPGQSNTAQRCR